MVSKPRKSSWLSGEPFEIEDTSDRGLGWLIECDDVGLRGLKNDCVEVMGWSTNELLRSEPWDIMSPNTLSLLSGPQEDQVLILGAAGLLIQSVD